MTLISTLMNGIGGQPSLGHEFVPLYPSYIPHHAAGGPYIQLQPCRQTQPATSGRCWRGRSIHRTSSRCFDRSCDPTALTHASGQCAGVEGKVTGEISGAARPDPRRCLVTPGSGATRRQWPARLALNVAALLASESDLHRLASGGTEVGAGVVSPEVAQ